MLKVLIYDENSIYIEKLMQQLSQIKTLNYIFTACSNKESLICTLKSCEIFQVIICDEIPIEILDHVKGIAVKFLWVERTTPNSTSEILKYQSVKGFLKALDSLLDLCQGPTSKENVSSQHVALILSPCGGSGKTTCAVSLAKLYSKDFKTLLLTFETQSDLIQRLGSEELPSMADLFYFVKRTDQSRIKGFQKLFVQDEYLGFTAFAPFKTNLDIQTVTLEDLEQCLNMIKEFCDFERIIIDSCGKLDGNNLMLLAETTELWMIDGTTIHADLRGEKMLHDISMHFIKNNLKSRFTLHRVTNDHNNSLSMNRGDQRAFILPFEPMIQDYYRAHVYSLLSKPYFKALKVCIDGNDL